MIALMIVLAWLGGAAYILSCVAREKRWSFQRAMFIFSIVASLGAVVAGVLL